MKLTQSKLKQLIKEEMQDIMAEARPDFGYGETKSDPYRMYDGPKLEGEKLQKAKELYDKYKPRKGSGQDNASNHYTAWQKAQWEALSGEVIDSKSINKRIEKARQRLEKLEKKVEHEYLSSAQSAINDARYAEAESILDSLAKTKFFKWI